MSNVSEEIYFGVIELFFFFIVQPLDTFFLTFLRAFYVIPYG